jgi:hypothetical protein
MKYSPSIGRPNTSLRWRSKEDLALVAFADSLASPPLVG